MACVLQIGAGGVGGVVAHKMAMNKEVFSRIVLASRNIAKCAAIADSIRAKGLGEIEIDRVDADNVDEIVALIEKYKPFLVVNVALPYQDLSIMEACLRTKTHYLDTANYEHPDSAHFEYKEQWAYDTRYKQAGIFALLGSGFDPGVTNVFCAYAQKHYFDEIHTIDILDCNAGDHGYAFATNFNPEINLREVSSRARYWIKGHSAFSDKSGSLIVGGGHYPLGNSLASNPHNPDFSSKILECQKGGASQENLTQDTRIAESGTDSRLSISIVPYEPSMLPAMLEIWEDSVRASHFFLKDSDIVEIKQEVKAAFSSLQNILVAKLNNDFAGFIGVSEKMIEMLFASPKFFNLGLGKRLILEACNAFFAKQDEILVDCNEQNERGLKFYQKLGFKQLGRSEKDSSGRDFAIIHFSITKAELLNKLNSLDFNIKANLALNPDLKKDEIYRKFEREEKHFKLESNTQDLKDENYFGGQWRDVAPLALMKEWEYPEVGVKNSYLLYHEELESLIRNIKGLRRIRFFMTFGESYLTHMKCLENVGLLRVDEVEHNGQKIVPIQVLKTLLPDPASLAPRTKGQTHIGCYIKGVKDGKERTIYIYNICEHEACYKEVNAQGVSYTTGVPAMIGAKLICEGKWGNNQAKFLNNANNADMPQGGEYQGIDSNNGSGVWNMEQNDPDPFMQELNKQGLPYVVLEIDSNGDSKVLEDGRK